MDDDSNEASYRAITSLAFVSPDTVLPQVIEQLHADLDSPVKKLQDSDFGIWSAPEGVTYVDGTNVIRSLHIRTLRLTCPRCVTGD